MKNALAQIIYAHDQDGTMEIREEDYSGRGMFGKATSGIVVEYQADFHKALASCWIDDPEMMEEEGFQIEDFNFSTDSMGRNIIFY